MSLIDKMRKAREQVVEAGGFTFTIRRPTQLEMIELSASPRSRGRAVLPFITGWSCVTGLDVIPGGDPHPLEFDAAVRDEWLTDRLDLLKPLSDAIFAAYTAEEARREDAKKN